MGHTGTVRVLLVEDDPEDAFLTGKLFSQIEHQQYELDWVDSYEEALGVLQTKRHDVCLLDFRLGSRTGVDFLREAHTSGCQIPTLILTGQSGYEVDLAASAAGAADYLVKSELTPPLLERAVRYARANHQREEELAQAQAQLRLVIEQLPGRVWTTDTQLRYTWMAGTNVENSDLALHALLGRPLTETVEEGNTESPRLFAHREALAGRAARYEDLLAGRPKEVQVRPLRAKDGSIIGTVAMALDITPQKQIEEQLQRQLNILKGVTEGTTDAIFVKDGTGHYLMINSAGANFLGRRVEEIIGRRDAEFFSSETLSQALETDRWALAGEIATREETLTAAGVTRTYHAVKAPLRDAEGRIVGLIGVSRDITERKQAEEELARSERRYASLVHATAQMVWRTSADGQLALGEHADWELLTGQTRAEREQDGWLAAVHPEDRPRVAALWQEILKAQEPAEEEFRARSASGEYRYLLARGVPVRDDAGEVVEWIGTCTDITERKQAELALQESEARFRTMAESAPAGIYVTDAAGNGVYVNPEISRQAGRPAAALMGKGWVQAMHLDDREEVLRRWSTAVQQRLVYENTQRWLRPDGETVWAFHRATPILEGERFLGHVGIAVDITAQRATEEALRASERRFRHLLDTANEGICTVDAAARFDYVNERLAQMLGWTMEELHGQTIFDVLFPEDHAIARTRQERRRAGQRDQFEERLRRKDGSVLWVSANVSPIQDAGGAFQGTLVMVTDVSPQREAVEALREQKELFEAVLDTIPAMVVLFGPDGRVQYGNRTWSQTLGWSLAEAKEIDLLPVIYPDIEERRRVCHFIEAAGGGWAEFVTRTQDGHALDTAWSNVRLSDGRCLGIGVDVTERKRSERELREALEAMEHAVEGIARLDAAGRYQQVNAAYAAMVGYTPQEMIGMEWIATAHAEDQPRILAAHERMLREGRVSVEALGVRKDGGTFHKSLVLVAIRDETGRFTGHYSFMKDVTERHQLEMQFLQAQKMEAVGKLAGGVAHDFNNMLAVINGYSSLLLESMGPDHSMRGYLTEIHKAGGRAADLTRQLLAFSRKQLLEPKVLDLNAVVHGIDKMLRRLIGEDIELVTLVDPQLERIKADPGQIEQVVMNLAVNARDAMPTGGKLVLRTRNATLSVSQAKQLGAEAGRYVVLEVQDTGSGIRPEILPHIFEPFFTTKEQDKGTGLGLATVYGIVKQSGGTIQVASEVGVGTTFTVYLPGVRETPLPVEDLWPMALPSGSETILVVEDEPQVRSMVRTLLTQCGYRVLEATQGDDALRVVESHDGPIHLLLTDVVMPRMSGRELAERVRHARPEVQVLFMTGYTDDAVMRHGVAKAEVELLQKPFAPLALAQRVRRILDTARAGALRGTLLLVDDDPAQCETLTELLDGKGYQVLTARNGQEALCLLRSGPRPDLILLDLMMPGMNGWTFRLEQLHDPRLTSIPVVVISGQPAAGVDEFLRPAAYLIKPVEVERLLGVISQLCPARWSLP